MGAISRNGGIMVSSALGMGLFMFAFDFTGPSAVWEGNQAQLHNRMYGVLPEQHKESDALGNLKETYPKFKNL